MPVRPASAIPRLCALSHSRNAKHRFSTPTPAPAPDDSSVPRAFSPFKKPERQQAARLKWMIGARMIPSSIPAPPHSSQHLTTLALVHGRERAPLAATLLFLGILAFWSYRAPASLDLRQSATAAPRVLRPLTTAPTRPRGGGMNDRQQPQTLRPQQQQQQQAGGDAASMAGGHAVTGHDGVAQPDGGLAAAGAALEPARGGAAPAVRPTNRTKAGSR